MKQLTIKHGIVSSLSTYCKFWDLISKVEDLWIFQLQPFSPDYPFYLLLFALLFLPWFQGKNNNAKKQKNQGKNNNAKKQKIEGVTWREWWKLKKS